MFLYLFRLVYDFLGLITITSIVFCLHCVLKVSQTELTCLLYSVCIVYWRLTCLLYSVCIVYWRYHKQSWPVYCILFALYIEGITNGADLLSYLILLHLLWPSRSILYLLKGEEPIPYDLLITGKLQVDVLLHNKDPQNLVTDGHQGHQIKHLYCFY